MVIFLFTPSSFIYFPFLLVFASLIIAFFVIIYSFYSAFISFSTTSFVPFFIFPHSVLLMLISMLVTLNADIKYLSIYVHIYYTQLHHLSFVLISHIVF